MTTRGQTNPSHRDLTRHASPPTRAPAPAPHGPAPRLRHHPAPPGPPLRLPPSGLPSSPGHLGRRARVHGVQDSLCQTVSVVPQALDPLRNAFGLFWNSPPAFTGTSHPFRREQQTDKNYAEGSNRTELRQSLEKKKEYREFPHLFDNCGSIRLETCGMFVIFPLARLTDMTESNRERSRPYPGMRQQNSSRQTDLLVTHRGGYSLILTPDHTTDPS